MHSMVEGASALRMFEESKILKKHGYKIDFLFVLGFTDFLLYLRDSKAWISRISKEIKDSRVFVTPRLPHNVGFVLKLFFSLINTFLCILKFNLIGGQRKYTILHAHLDMFGFYSAVISKFSGVTNFYDCHGFRYEEIVLAKGDNYSRLLYDFEHNLEKYTLKNSDEVIAVSNKMRDYIEELVSVKTWLVPMGINKNIFHFNGSLSQKLRNKFKLNGKKVLIYSGNFSRYQCFDYMKLFFRGINELSKDYHFIVLVPPKERRNVTKFFSDSKNLPLSILSVKHENVKYLLSASDLGIMLREDSIVNKLASPTKFAEYLGSGIPVLSTAFVGDFSEFMVNNNAGLILNLDRIKDRGYLKSLDVKISNLIEKSNNKKNIERLRSLAINNFSWTDCTKDLLKLYAKHSS